MNKRHLYLAAQQGVTPSEFREDLDTHKSIMNGLSCGEESMTICSAVLIQCQRVTDRRTDVQPIAKTCFSIADARKNKHVSDPKFYCQLNQFSSCQKILLTEMSCCVNFY